MYYIACGLDLNPTVMTAICPEAVPIVAHEMKDARLVFRGGQTAPERAKGHSLFVAIWDIPEDYDMDAAARPSRADEDTGCDKLITRIKISGVESPAVVYRTRAKRWLNPGAEDISLMVEGYQFWGMPISAIDEAIEESTRRASLMLEAA
jgi:hypothetical protein